uniref:Uncharacterized protein n=1 Tax=Leishmania guyanensis TaxID=5670 RepID=A0A1E1IR07_LEIGU|nr:Hypothetical protein BN36_1112090 [Leishmania guyanensis]
MSDSTYSFLASACSVRHVLLKRFALEMLPELCYTRCSAMVHFSLILSLFFFCACAPSHHLSETAAAVPPFDCQRCYPLPRVRQGGTMANT